MDLGFAQGMILGATFLFKLFIEMRKKCVLVIDDDVKEAEKIISALHDSRISIRHVRNGRAALTVLMGIGREEDYHKVNPDVIIIRNILPDMTAYEMCNVLRNYYRFGKVKFYVIHAPEDAPSFTAGYDGLLFAGRIERPIAPGSKGYLSLEQLKHSLSPGTLASLIPFITFSNWNTKAAGLKATFATSMKVAACTVGICITGYAFTTVDADASPHLTTINVLPAVSVQSPVEEVTEVEVEPTVAQPAPASKEIVPEPVYSEPIPEIVAVDPEPVIAETQDSVQAPKTYSIGIQPAGEGR
jgi:CheY-like chemotaxis protein